MCIRDRPERDYRYFRRLCISTILDTDLQKHFIVTNKFKSLLALGPVSVEDEVNKLLILSIAIKAADIGHGAKDLRLHKVWSRRVVEEFWHQGDVELKRNLPVSPLCDRRNRNVAKSQEGFLKAIVLPLYESFGEFLKSDVINQNCFEQIKTNCNYWTQEAERENDAKGTFLQETEGVLAEIEDCLLYTSPSPRDS
eukprot:TRINITY_DN5556_c0_g1_i1.p1 TRINITY_DN5556_c0_g1~~TRINITY_DN5556_c0_g1_i1.p1  ORF type:complete len:196 (+),score=37.55 TRINITY_DN5556_c0_g1_i1:61-648(+)